MLQWRYVDVHNNQADKFCLRVSLALRSIDDQGSISSKSYTRLFCKKVFREAFLLLQFGIVIFGTRISVQNLSKTCRWNWLHGSITPTFYEKLLLIADLKSTKRQWWLDCIFALLGSSCVKALRKLVGEIDPRLKNFFVIDNRNSNTFFLISHLLSDHSK